MGMTGEKIPSFNALGNDIDESRLALEEILLNRLGSVKLVSNWMQRSNDLLGGALPEVVLLKNPDKVVVAAMAARAIQTQ